MKRLIISGFSVLLIIAATTPVFAYGKVKKSDTGDSQSIPASSSKHPSAVGLMRTQSNKEPQSKSSTSPLLDPNPPAEVPSPSLIRLGA